MSDVIKSNKDERSAIIVTFDKCISTVKQKTNVDNSQVKSSSISSNSNNNSNSQTLISPDVEKNVREFSRCTALYTMLIISIGTMRDSGKLREDISIVRQRGWELANYNKSLLVPRMRQANSSNFDSSNSVDADAYKNLERVFFMFCSCLEFFMEQLLRTVDLLTSFKLNSNNVPDTNTFVNSGLTDSMPGCLYLRAAASSISASPINSPVPTARRHSAFNFRFNAPRLKQHNKHVNTLLGDKNKSENQEMLLKKDIKALKDLILEIHSSIPMTPWTIQPQYHLERLQADHGSLISLADSSDDCELDSNRSSTCKYYPPGTSSKPTPINKNSQINATKKRCIVVTISLLVAAFLLAIGLGVSIRLLV